jgi:Na+-transporting methylmalonyl-CoA/oxaloacetate decarboxylase gamma subunit
MSDLAWGLQMTALGMGLVFGLLALLWGLLTLVQRLDRPAPGTVDPAAPPDAPGWVAATAQGAGTAGVPALAAADPTAVPEPTDPMQTQTHTAALVQGMDAELVAAILVATLRHRAILRREAAPATRRYWPGSMLYVSRWVGAGRSRQNSSWQRRSK